MTVKAWKRKHALMRKLARSACRLLAGAGDIPKAILTEPTPPEEAAQRLAGMYMTRKEKKAALFGFVYGQRGVATGRLPSLPAMQQVPRRRR